MVPDKNLYGVFTQSGSQVAPADVTPFRLLANLTAASMHLF